MMMTYAECLARWGSDRVVAGRLKRGELYKIERGLYSDRPRERLVDIAAKRYPSSVVAMDSAFYYQGLTDVVPDRLHLATARDTAKISDPRIRQHFVPSSVLGVGKTVIEKGGGICTYDLERLCIDVVKNRRKMPYDLYKEVVLSLRRRTGEMYPAKIDDYLDAFPYREKLLELIEKEIF